MIAYYRPFIIGISIFFFKDGAPSPEVLMAGHFPIFGYHWNMERTCVMGKICLIVLVLSIFSYITAADGKDREEKKMAEMSISSPAFENNGTVPQKYTCDGSDINPPLKITGIPSSAKSMALIVDDPDAPAGIWVHWLVWNIDPGTPEIKENSVPSGAVQGLNDFRKKDYGGPCPPSGTHRYFFKLYALDKRLDLKSGASKADLEKTMAGHIVGQAELVGLYSRK
jgi:hypothetical protein